MEKNILIIAGEPSGDLHGANLVRALKEISPQIRISGVGGKLMQKEGVEIYQDISNLVTFGFFDALRKIRRFLRLRDFLLEKIKKNKPNAIVLIDFSGFNLRFAKSLNKSIPIFYYISPQLWASRFGRIKTMKEYINKVIVIFKFEEELYKRYGIDAEFIGHPLLDIVKITKTKEEILEEFKLSKDSLIISLLPGSRKTEVKMILPVMLKTCSLLKKELDCQFIIAKAKELDLSLYEESLKKFDFPVKVIENKIYDCLEISDLSLICSGTTTIEATIMEKPFVIIYKTTLPNYFLYRALIKTPYIGMVNIISGKKIIEEFIQFRARPEKICEKVLEILRDKEKIERIKEELAFVKEKLGSANASKKAAEIILRQL